MVVCVWDLQEDGVAAPRTGQSIEDWASVTTVSPVTSGLETICSAELWGEDNPVNAVHANFGEIWEPSEPASLYSDLRDKVEQ